MSDGIQIAVETHVTACEWADESAPTVVMESGEDGKYAAWLKVGEHVVIDEIYNGTPAECAGALRSYAAVFSKAADIVEGELAKLRDLTDTIKQATGLSESEANAIVTQWWTGCQKREAA